MVLDDGQMMNGQRKPVHFDPTLPAGWEWDDGDPYSGRATHKGCDLWVQRYKAGGGLVQGIWQVRRGTAGTLERGGFGSALAAAAWAQGGGV